MQGKLSDKWILPFVCLMAKWRFFRQSVYRPSIIFVLHFLRLQPKFFINSKGYDGYQDPVAWAWLEFLSPLRGTNSR